MSRGSQIVTITKQRYLVGVKSVWLSSKIFPKTFPVFYNVMGNSQRKLSKNKINKSLSEGKNDFSYLCEEEFAV